MKFPVSVDILWKKRVHHKWISLSPTKLLVKPLGTDTSLKYGHLYITNSFQCPDKILIYFVEKKNL